LQKKQTGDELFNQNTIFRDYYALIFPSFSVFYSLCVLICFFQTFFIKKLFSA